MATQKPSQNPGQPVAQPVQPGSPETKRAPQLPPIQSPGASANTPLLVRPGELQWFEFPTGAALIGKHICGIRVSRSMKYRKFYAWLYGEAGSTPTDSGIWGRVVILDNRATVAEYDISAGISQTTGTVVPKSLMSAFAVMGNIDNNTLYFTPKSPTANQPSNVILQPLQFKGECDEAYIVIDGFAGLSAGNNMRAVLACVSSY